MIENIDENFGLLLDKLESWKLLENTVVIFMSDNGMTGGGSGRAGKVIGQLADGTKLYPYNADMKGQKGSTDEGGVRVPFFVRWDGKITPGEDVATVAAHIDLYPTLAALAGATLPAGQVEGRNLLPLMDPTVDVQWADRYLFTHKGRWKTGADPNASQWKGFAVRNSQYRFVDNTALYDMLIDPSQKTNIIDQHPELVSKMRAAYDEWWKGTVPMMVNEKAPMSPTRPYHVLFEAQQKNGGIPDWVPPEL